MKKQLQEALGVLIGQPLWSSVRTLDMQSFDFGQRTTTKSRRGNKCEVGEYALHVQCGWRIRHGDRVVVGHRDLHFPPEGMDAYPEDFDWKKQVSMRDRRIAELFQNQTQFLVRDLEVGEAGGFTLVLNDGYELDVFPDDSLSQEHWRLFKPFSGERHFVLTGKGLEP